MDKLVSIGYVNENTQEDKDIVKIIIYDEFLTDKFLKLIKYDNVLISFENKNDKDSKLLKEIFGNQVAEISKFKLLSISNNVVTIARLNKETNLPKGLIYYIKPYLLEYDDLPDVNNLPGWISVCKETKLY